MEIHFYERAPHWVGDGNVYVDYVSTNEAIERKVSFIETTQMHLLSTSLLIDGYKVFIHYAKGDVYEVELYKSRTPNHIVITPSKNLRALWASGALSV
jgi:hypothetical protein